VTLLLLAAAGLILAGASPRKDAAAKKGNTADANAALLAAARDNFDRGRTDDARSLLAKIPAGGLAPEKADAADYLRAQLEENGTAYDQALASYLTRYPKGTFRREVTLAQARLRYVSGDYDQAENLLAIFTPGVERSAAGREGLVLRGLAQLGRGDAAGALQFLTSAEGDLKDSPQEEDYYYATAQAGLRANKPQAAMAALRTLLERHANGDYAPQALYAMGTALEAVGRQADAASVFRQVAQRFPLSYEAARVRDRGIRPGDTTQPLLPLGGGFAIQIGAFSRRDLADALAAELRRAGNDDISVRQGDETPPLFRVRAGSFATRDEARALGERLRRDRGFSYQVVPR